MKKSKLILEPFNPKEKEIISPELLSKLFGGEDYAENSNKGTSNSTDYTFSVEKNMELEKSKEN